MQATGRNFCVIILSVCVVLGLLYLLAPILTPFLVGALLAYLADPLVTQLMRFRLPRLWCVVIVFVMLSLAMFLLILLLIPLIETQIDTLADMIPNIIIWFQETILPWVMLHFGLQEEIINVKTLKATLAANWSKAGGIAGWLWMVTVHSGRTLIEWLIHLILIPVVTFYLLWDKLIQGCRNLFPRDIEPTAVRLIKECDSVLSAFFRGQLLVMLALGSIYSIGLTLAGLQIGLMIGLISGLLSIVPYLGSIVGILIATIAALVQFGTFSSVVVVWLIFLLGHAIDHSVLTPYLVGNRIGLHPVAVIFAILAGGVLFGFFGVLLALPVAAVIMVLVRYLYGRYRNSELYRHNEA
jgi:predicted PurR-regulated permease PerM